MPIKENTLPKHWVVLASLSVIIGFFLLFVSLYYLRLYFIEVENSYRHEYLMGATMAIIMALTPWLVATFSLFKIKNDIPRYIYISTVIITISIFLLVIINTLAPVLIN